MIHALGNRAIDITWKVSTAIANRYRFGLSESVAYIFLLESKCQQIGNQFNIVCSHVCS